MKSQLERLFFLDVEDGRRMDEGYECVEGGREPGAQDGGDQDPGLSLVGLQHRADHARHGAHGRVQHVAVLSLQKCLKQIK